jgi:hypothetical protein
MGFTCCFTSAGAFLVHNWNKLVVRNLGTQSAFLRLSAPTARISGLLYTQLGTLTRTVENQYPFLIILESSFVKVPSFIKGLGGDCLTHFLNSFFTETNSHFNNSSSIAAATALSTDTQSLTRAREGRGPKMTHSQKNCLFCTVCCRPARPQTLARPASRKYQSRGMVLVR